MSAWAWFGATLVALGVLFAASLRAPQGQGRWRVLGRVLGVAGALAAAAAANVIVFRHDLHLDLTHEQAFTPAPETLQVLDQLQQDVELTYFYQSQNPAGRAAKQMVEIMARHSPRLHVRTVDPDQQPAVANQMGVRLYNAAVLVSGGRRVEVVSTEDREIALGILRLLRRDTRALCFAAGHGEYDIDNFEFHTHFEGSHAHSHDAGGMAVVQMEQHGTGRLRRALDKLGYAVTKLNLATTREVAADCAALVVANPRTPFAPHEVATLARWLEGGGNLLLLVEPDYVLGPEWTAMLARAGIAVDEGVVNDARSHYYNDEQMVAVERYAAHPATLGLALSFFPGARPLRALPAPGVRTTVLFATSDSATLAARAGMPAPADAGPRARPLAIAAEGTLTAGGKPFKLAVVGDADFASNSFYPYLANADLVLGLSSWLRGEPRGPAMKPPVEVLPMVVMTNAQMQLIFVLCVLVLPGLCAAVGLGVWWRRRH
ncbi:MAG: Gldg family protein [Rubrivivax sp.]